MHHCLLFYLSPSPGSFVRSFVSTCVRACVALVIQNSSLPSIPYHHTISPTRSRFFIHSSIPSFLPSFLSFYIIFIDLIAIGPFTISFHSPSFTRPPSDCVSCILVITSTPCTIFPKHGSPKPSLEYPPGPCN